METMFGAAEVLLRAQLRLAGRTWSVPHGTRNRHMKVWGLDFPHHICPPMLAENSTSDVWVCLLALSRREFMWGRHDTFFPRPHFLRGSHETRPSMIPSEDLSV